MPDVAPHRGVRSRDRRIQVACPQNDAVETVVEQRAGPEEVEMQRASDRRRMGETHVLRRPCIAGKRPHGAKEDADHQLGRLARAARSGKRELRAQRRGVAAFHELKGKRFAVEKKMPLERLDGVPHGRLLAQQQADRTDMCELALGREPQSEILDSCGRGRLFEQRQHPHGGDQHVGIVQSELVQAHALQHTAWVEADRPRDVGIAGQGRCADHVGGFRHFQAVPRCKVNVAICKQRAAGTRYPSAART